MRQLLVLAFVVGCSEPDVCDEGTIRQPDGSCLTYEPDEPVQADTIALAPGVTWQWQITGDIDTSHDVAVYDVDLFDITPADREQLAADDRIVLCYFSAGSYEPWKDDAHLIPDEAIGRPLDGWPDERWLDHTNPAVREVMLGRLDRAVETGCHGAEPDNVTAWRNNSGFGLNATEQLDYNRFLADAAHERGLAVALKNDTDQIPELEPWFDFAVNEECAFYDECEDNQPFLDAGKAVLHAEYVDDWADAEARAAEVCGVPGHSTVIKTWDLGPEFLSCT